MGLSVTTHHGNCRVIRLDVAGALHGAAAERLTLMIVEVLVVHRPDELLVNLDAVDCVSLTGVRALLCGYVTAIDCGTSYRILNAQDQVCHLLRATGTLDVLADSDDLGALLLALLTLPAPR